MTPTPTPPEQPAKSPSQAVQLTKLVIGGIVALAGLVAFTVLALHDKVDLSTAAPLIGAILGGGVLGGHGALKMTPGTDQ